MGNRIHDLVGERFGLLTVIERSESKTNCGNYRWECVCDCGNTVTVAGGDLLSGHTKSCGCYNYTKFKRKNEYDLSGEYGIGYCRLDHAPFYFDKEDYEKIKDYCWRIVNGYPKTSTNVDSVHKDVMLHRFVLGITDPNVHIDHINCNKADARKSNLRICNQSQNGINRPVNKNNLTGYRGVGKNGNGYMARIKKDGKTYYLGWFKTPEEAYAARMKAEKEMFGEFAYKGDAGIAQQ